MKYRYNYSFLEKWMNENRKTSGELLEVIGTTDYTALRRWINGEKMMRIDGVLRLCNAYNIPLACFFVNIEDTSKDFIVPKYQDTDTIKANILNTDKKRNELDPDIQEVGPSELPQRWMELYIDKINDIEAGKKSKYEAFMFNVETRYKGNFNKINDQIRDKEIELKRKYAKDKEFLQDQIIKKDKVIADLSKALSNMTLQLNKLDSSICSGIVSEERTDDIK